MEKGTLKAPVYYPMSDTEKNYGKKVIDKYWPFTKQYGKDHRNVIEAVIQCMQLVKHRKDKEPEKVLEDLLDWLHRG